MEGVDDGVDAVGIPLAHLRDEVGRAVKDIVGSEAADVVGVLGADGHEDGGAPAHGQSRREAPDATVGADDEDRLARLDTGSVHQRQCLAAGGRQ